MWESPYLSSLFEKKDEGASISNPWRCFFFYLISFKTNLRTRRGPKKKKKTEGERKVLKKPFRYPSVFVFWLTKKKQETRNPETTPVDGYLGSREDEERSETRYVMRIAGTSEPSNLRTHPALSAPPRARPSECRPQVPLIPFFFFSSLKERRGGTVLGLRRLPLCEDSGVALSTLFFRAKRSGILEKPLSFFLHCLRRRMLRREKRARQLRSWGKKGFGLSLQPRPRHQKVHFFLPRSFLVKKFEKEFRPFLIFLDIKPFKNNFFFISTDLGSDVVTRRT